MTRTRILVLTLLTAVLCLAPSAARQAAEKAPAATQQKPEGITQMERLQLLVGTWSYTETYEKTAWMPEGGGGMGTYVARPGPGGYSFIVDFTTHTKIGDEIGHGILTWDAKEKAYKQYITGNSFPGCFIITGHWEGDLLVFQGEFEAAGIKTVLKTVYTEWKPNSMTILEYYRVGDAPFQLLQTTKATKPIKQ